MSEIQLFWLKFWYVISCARRNITPIVQTSLFSRAGPNENELEQRILLIYHLGPFSTRRLFSTKRLSIVKIE